MGMGIGARPPQPGQYAMRPQGSPLQKPQYGMRPQQGQPMHAMGQPMQGQGMPSKYGHAPSPLQFPTGQPLQRNQYDFAQAVFGGNDRLQNRPYLNFRQMMGR